MPQTAKLADCGRLVRNIGLKRFVWWFIKELYWTKRSRDGDAGGGGVRLYGKDA